MSHFAVFAPPFPSHVRVIEALAGELMDRGHRITWLHMAEVQRLLRDPRTGFAALGARSHPRGTLERLVARAARPGGPVGIARVIRDMAECTELLCREAPDRCRGSGVDAVLADQMEAAGGLVARALALPFVSVACALPINREPHLPLPVMPWRRAEAEAGLHLNRHSARVYDWMMRPHTRVIERQAHQLAAGRLDSLEACLSPLAQLSQTVAAFDFERFEAPATLHHVGPLRGADEPAAPWPAGFEPAADKPFVFASLGTLQGGRFALLQRIAQACSSEGAQVLIAHCDRLDPVQAAALRRAGATWVTGFAPQQEAIARAHVVVTHAGLNTVLDSLRAGKPMLVLPIAFDQPGVAARVVHAGAGLRVLPAFATVSSLRTALRQLLTDGRFTRQAQALGTHVRAAGGVRMAADLVETAVRTGEAVRAVQRPRPTQAEQLAGVA